MTGVDPAAGWAGFVALLAEMPDVVERLTAEHVPDRNGRCRECRVPGHGTPGAAWPCTLANLASAAKKARC